MGAVLEDAAAAGRIAAHGRLKDAVPRLGGRPELSLAAVAAQPAVVGKFEFFEYGRRIIAFRAARRQAVAGAGAEDTGLKRVGFVVGRSSPDLQLPHDSFRASA